MTMSHYLAQASGPHPKFKNISYGSSSHSMSGANLLVPAENEVGNARGHNFSTHLSAVQYQIQRIFLTCVSYIPHSQAVVYRHDPCLGQRVMPINCMLLYALPDQLLGRARGTAVWKQEGGNIPFLSLSSMLPYPCCPNYSQVFKMLNKMPKVTSSILALISYRIIMRTNSENRTEHKINIREVEKVGGCLQKSALQAALIRKVVRNPEKNKHQRLQVLSRHSSIPIMGQLNLLSVPPLILFFLYRTGLHEGPGQNDFIVITLITDTVM